VHVVDVTTGIGLAATVSAVAPEPIVLGAADTRAPEPTLELIHRFQPDLVASFVEPLARAPTRRIDARWVARDLTEDLRHELGDLRVDRRRGGMVQIDGAA